MKSPKITMLILMFLGLITMISLPAFADVYRRTSENDVIYLTDNNEGENYELLAIEPVIQDEQLISAKQKIDISSGGFKKLNFAIFKDEIRHAAEENNIDINLIHAIISVESDYNPKAVSSKGAVGLMQLMPATAKRFGVVDSFNPYQNIHGGARYLAYLLKTFNNDKRLAVAAYNSGEQSVIKYGVKIPPYRETITYVSRVSHLILM